MIERENKIKVAFLLPNVDLGGAEKITINLLNKINKEYFEVLLVLGEKRGHLVDKIPKEISVIDLKTTSNFLFFLRIISCLKKEKPDIFVSVFPRFNMISLVARFFIGNRTKIIIADHTTFSCAYRTAKTLFRRIVARFIFPYLMKIFYPRAETIICVSRGAAQDLLRIINIPNKIKIIYNPIIGKDIYSLLRESLEHPWFSEQNIPIVIAVGNLTKAKDYPNLLAAFPLVLKEQSARLIILGEGKERKKLEGLIKKLKIEKDVALLGLQENPYKYMAMASVFVLSSLQEGFPTVIVEAMACGAPVVSTNCQSGPNEIIENGKNGILVPVGDEKALSKAILKLLKNADLREKFSEEGKKRAQDFTIEKSVKEYEKLFEELLK